MDSDRDPYEVLGVPRGASDGEIKEAYREKAKEFHPDASDREDAAEVFKRVKEAYEEIYTEGETVSSSSEPSSADTRREAGTKAETGRKTKTRTESDRKQGFGAGTRRETGGPGHGYEPGAGFGGEERSRGDDTQGRTTKRGFGDEESEGDEETSEEDGDPEEFEVHKKLGLGWELGETEAGSWFIFTESETAPYVDGTQMLYLDKDGRMSHDPVYFGKREAAEETYEEHYGVGGGFEHENEEDWEDSHRGFSPGGESYARRTEERQDGFEDDGWGERVEAAELDELWRLYYQERGQEGGAETEKRTQRRWGVTTDVAGDDRFVNPSGEYQEVEFWFEERSEAVGAYERYVRNTRAAREGFGGATAGEKRGAATPSAADRSEEEEGFTVKTASKGYFLYEDLYEATEPIRENRLTAATLATAFLALSAYLFEPFRGLLFLLFLPVYIGVVTIVQTPYLLFFVFAYTVVVTTILIIHISMKY